MSCLTPSLHRNPPDCVILQFRKIPAPYALILVWQNGKMENAEFVADYYEGTEILWKEFFSWKGEWQRWRGRVASTIAPDKNYELWAKHKNLIFMVHPNQWWI